MNPDQLLIAGLACGAFVFGAVPFAYLFALWIGRVDIREQGSGNPGASNAFRVAGPVPGLLAFLFDGAKGAAPVLARRILLPEMEGEAAIWLDIALGALAIIGHVYTPFLGFRGGKGVATLIGVFAVLFPLGLLIAAVASLIAMGISRYFSVGSLVGVVALSVSYFFVHEEPFAPANLPILYLSLAGLVLLFIRHRDNIRRLVRGEEHSFRRRESD
ncbi:MAG: glycerol-3-phosphate acyltransferase [Spirochaetales bacterium]|nr:glycerol-3-phosphate acyltransferase [Leptospiraceae bacterium]MCP5483767.1 glycerol-3-phosphate acyltransferase [Spirochaetales bacterium]